MHRLRGESRFGMFEEERGEQGRLCGWRELSGRVIGDEVTNLEYGPI